MKSLIAITLIPLLVFAIEAVNPGTLCDRFVNSIDQKYCQKKIQQLSPDSYLAGACQKQFDDDAFWDCLELAKVASFDPKKTDKCSGNDLGDEQRLTCLRAIADYSGSTKSEFQRLPTSLHTSGASKAASTSSEATVGK